MSQDERRRGTRSRYFQLFHHFQLFHLFHSSRVSVPQTKTIPAALPRFICTPWHAAYIWTQFTIFMTRRKSLFMHTNNYPASRVPSPCCSQGNQQHYTFINTISVKGALRHEWLKAPCRKTTGYQSGGPSWGVSRFCLPGPGAVPKSPRSPKEQKSPTANRASYDQFLKSTREETKQQPLFEKVAIPQDKPKSEDHDVQMKDVSLDEL